MLTPQKLGLRVCNCVVMLPFSEGLGNVVCRSALPRAAYKYKYKIYL